MPNCQHHLQVSLSLLNCWLACQIVNAQGEHTIFTAQFEGVAEDYAYPTPEEDTC